MNENVIAHLDLLLACMLKQPFGFKLTAAQLVQAAKLELTYENLFLVTILIDDNHLTKINTPSQTQVVALSASGFKFYHTGGYAGFYKNNSNDLAQNQEKLKLEIRDLQWGFWISLISLILSIIAIVIGVFYDK